MFKHLALTNNELASTLFEPWSQYMPQAGSVQGEQGGGFAGSVWFGCSCVLGFLVFFFFFFPFFSVKGHY